MTPIPIGDPPPELAALRPNFNGYALGFGVRDYRGRKALTHTGGLPGYVSRVAMIPDRAPASRCSPTRSRSAAFDAIVNRVPITISARPQPTGSTRIRRSMTRSKSATGRDGQQDSLGAQHGVEAVAPAREVRRHLLAMPGTATSSIAEEGGKLVMRFTHTPELVGDMEHWQYDTFVVRWRDRELRADAFVTFALTPEGAIDQAKMEAMSPSTDFSFDFQDLVLKPRQAAR